MFLQFQFEQSSTAWFAGHSNQFRFVFICLKVRNTEFFENIFKLLVLNIEAIGPDNWKNKAQSRWIAMGKHPLEKLNKMYGELIGTGGGRVVLCQ